MSFSPQHTVSLLDFDPDPTDIGPAVARAKARVLALGGGRLLIPGLPSYLSSGVADQWIWETFVDIDLGANKNFELCGIVGETMIRVVGGGAICRIGNNGPGIIKVHGIIFTGDPLAGVDCTNCIDIAQTRIAIVTECEFWGIRANATGFGVLRIIADNIHVEDCIAVGCDYTGMAYEGGVFSLTGLRDGLLVAGCRFDANAINLNGTVYGKAGSAENGALWIGGQGPAQPGQPAYGGATIEHCHFALVGPKLFDVGFLPELDGGDQFIISKARCRDCSFNCPGNTGASIVSDFAMQVDVDECTFVANGANTDAIQIGNADHLRLHDCTFEENQLRITFTGPVTYCEIDECPKTGVIQYNIAAESSGATLNTIPDGPRNASEKLNGATHHLMVDARDIESADLVALYDANLGITLNGGNVSGWDDSSGNGDANRNLVQANGALQPAYNASDAVYNDQASIGDFDAGAGEKLRSVGVWTDPPPAKGYIVVVGNTGGAGTEIYFQDISGNDYELYQNAATTSLVWFLSVVFASVVSDLNRPHVIGIDLNHDASRIYQDGATWITKGNPGTSAPDGIEVSGQGTFAGKICYLAFFKTRPSLGDLQRLVEGLGARYGIEVGA